MTTEELQALVDELFAELDASGVEDATAWEKWPTLEKYLYVLAERAVRTAER